MTGGVVFLMNKTKLENQKVHRHLKKCRHETSLECHVGVSDAFFYQMFIENSLKFATND